MKFKHDKTKTTKILMYAHNPGGGGGGHTFSGFWGHKIQVCRDLKIERFT